VTDGVGASHSSGSQATCAGAFPARGHGRSAPGGGTEEPLLPSLPPTLQGWWWSALPAVLPSKSFAVPRPRLETSPSGGAQALDLLHVLRSRCVWSIPGRAAAPGSVALPNTPKLRGAKAAPRIQLQAGGEARPGQAGWSTGQLPGQAADPTVDGNYGVKHQRSRSPSALVLAPQETSGWRRRSSQ